MSQPYVSGPVWIYVGVGANDAPLFIGTAEDAPDIDQDPDWEPVYNDVGGKKPIDYSYQREEHTISMTLTKFNWAVVQSVMNRPNPAGAAGLLAPGDVGTLMITEGIAYPLWLQFPYAPAAAGAGTSPKPAYIGMPVGRRYLATWLIGPDKIKPGTKAKKIQLIFKAVSVFQSGQKAGTPIANQAANFGWQLYDFNLTGLPGPN